MVFGGDIDPFGLRHHPLLSFHLCRSKSTARKEGLTGVEFRDVAGIGPILAEIMEVVEVRRKKRVLR